ncbi:P-loop containing nucleoside triphosphate hydrolase protein [Gongronella butleri]|nr:P-loop containing nucleoside triphosphate hydrolase protein [Gongronella butleri]
MLEVIGAGFGRTGTHSLWLALDKLGYSTQHMRTLIQDETANISVYEHAFDNPYSPDTDWELAYKGFNAAVDHPTCNFYKELSDVYPNAKVILTVRSTESWIKSIRNTVGKQFRTMKDLPPGHVGELMAMVRRTSFGGLLENDIDKLDDDDFMKNLFEQHIEQVKKDIPAERLLIMNLGDGWDKLCPFLGKPIPDEEYPVSNSTAEFVVRATMIKNQENPFNDEKK